MVQRVADRLRGRAATRQTGELRGEPGEQLLDQRPALRLPDGTARRLKVRSLVGLLPLCAIIVVSQELLDKLPDFAAHVAWIQAHRPELAEQMAHIATPGRGGLHLFSALDERMRRRVLAHVLDED